MGVQRDLVVTRVFNAPVESVWNCWVDPELVMQWWGPDHFTSPLAKIDFREGGVSLVCMRAPEAFGGQDSYCTWRYTKIEPMQLIEYVQDLTDADGKVIDPASIGMPSAESQMGQFAEIGLNQCMDKMVRALSTS